MKIKEIIVVEGRDDTVAIKRAVDADTIETGGSAINEQVILKIQRACEKRGVIIFTDPDYPGERIRKIISRSVPGCKHAFIKVEEGTYKGDIGVENASPEAIVRALCEVRTEMTDEYTEEISMDDLIQAGMTSGVNSKERRIKLGERLGIGYSNAKQLYKRLNMFQVSKAEFVQALAHIDKGGGGK